MYYNCFMCKTKAYPLFHCRCGNCIDNKGFTPCDKDGSITDPDTYFRYMKCNNCQDIIDTIEDDEEFI